MFQRAKRATQPLFALLGVVIASAAISVAQAQETPGQASADTGLSKWVQTAREEQNLIAVGAIIASRDGIIDAAVDGVRSHGSEDEVQLGDPWHLGSNTKALTALLYAKLVERDLAHWQATLPELFPGFADEMDPAWKTITIEDLFAHRTGMKQMGGFWLNARRKDERSVSEQRTDAAYRVLRDPPSKDPAEFDYNNLNYIVAGAAIEDILRAQDDLPNTWESAMRLLLFSALETSVDASEIGFGPPQVGLQGHRVTFGVFTTAVGRGKNADNPAALGPAGTAHATLRAHALLASEFLKDSSTLVPVPMREKLFSPYPTEDATYAMGWGIYDDPKFGRLYLHSGSNTMWTSQIIIAPDLDRVVIVNVNQFTDSARAAIRSISTEALDAALSSDSP